MPQLTGARVKATDLRAGAALVLAGLVAGGRRRYMISITLTGLL